MNADPELNAMIIAALSESGFDGFEETEDKLIAYANTKNADHVAAESLLREMNISFIRTETEEQNWNALWESNFPPIEMDDFVHIRADFHQAKKGFDHEIIITPKMSFGTGHHATTYSMIKAMRLLNFTNKSVCDYGTGTGVLAILAEKLGAAEVLAIDNDDWSIENAAENFKRNNCQRISIIKEDSINEKNKFDIVLANINRNVLLENMKNIADAVKPKGDILLSGFYTEDIPTLLECTNNCSLTLISQAVNNNWVCLHLKKN